MRVKRQALIVWYKHRRNIRQLMRHGHLIYASRRLRYAVIYVYQDSIAETEKELEKLPYVTKVERSYKPFVATSFENAKPDEAKLYDYK